MARARRGAGGTLSREHAGLPTGNVSVSGNTPLWNNTFQYKIFKNFRLEMEVNFTHYYYYGGNGKIVPTSHPGQTLVYLTRGLVLGRFRLKDRLSFTVGAVLRSQRRHFHLANHIPISSSWAVNHSVQRADIRFAFLLKR
jgi:hypothetical protein